MQSNINAKELSAGTAISREPVLVSVAIPAWNSADYLRQAIESVLAQTHQPIEIIVVDDGSTDHTREVCEAFVEKVRYFYQDNDGTMGNGARNRAIREAKGDWIALLDQDDRWLPTKIQQQIEAASFDINIGAIFTSIVLTDAYNAPINRKVLTPPSGDVYHELLRGNPYTASSGMFRRDIIAECGLPAEDSSCGDWDLWLRIARFYRVHTVNDQLTEYRLHSESFTNDPDRSIRAVRGLLLSNQNKLHPRCRQCRSSYRAGWASLAYWQLVKYHRNVRSGDLSNLFPLLWQAFKTSPLQVIRPRQLIPIFKSSIIGVIKSFQS